MKYIGIYLICIFLIGFGCRENSMKSISVANFKDPKKLLGLLKQPLGSLVIVEGKFIDGNSTKMKFNSDKLLFKVVKVDDKLLPTPILFSFKILNSSFVNIKFKSKKKLLVYESGYFGGIPSEVFKYIPAMSSRDFNFYSYLNIVKEL